MSEKRKMIHASLLAVAPKENRQVSTVKTLPRNAEKPRDLVSQLTQGALTPEDRERG
jgi:hypothetical protein